MTPTTRAFHFCVTTPAMAVAGLVLAVFTLIAVPFGWLEDYLDNRKQRKQVPEIPPAEERPYIPQPSRDALAEDQRIKKAIREEYLRAAYVERQERARVQAQINALVREVEGV